MPAPPIKFWTISFCHTHTHTHTNKRSNTKTNPISDTLKHHKPIPKCPSSPPSSLSLPPLLARWPSSRSTPRKLVLREISHPVLTHHTSASRPFNANLFYCSGAEELVRLQGINVLVFLPLTRLSCSSILFGSCYGLIPSFIWY